MQMDCVEPQHVPFGPGYQDDQYRGCTLTGSAPGDSSIDGSTYIETQYLASTGIVWRNAGIIIAWWVFWTIFAAIGYEVNVATGSGSKILFDRRSRQKQLARMEDLENGAAEKAGEISNASSDTEGEDLHIAETVFTFKDISYFVHHEGKEKQLLQKVSGFVKPGQLVALMGSSGAGKTTLMDAIAQRKDSGRLEGSIMVDGQPQSISFQRTTGYCEQNDVHEPTATVWEALLFSARLRQPYDTPDEEKQGYVRRVMDLLELMPLQHALIGCE